MKSFFNQCCPRHRVLVSSIPYFMVPSIRKLLHNHGVPFHFLTKHEYFSNHNVTTTVMPKTTSFKKITLYFTYESRNTLKAFTSFFTFKTVTKLNLEHSDKFEIEIEIIYHTWFTFSRQRRIWLFHVVILQRTVKKCTKNYNTRAQPLFCSLNLSFSDVPVPVAVVVFLNSIIN